MKVAIYGAGAVGCVIGEKLHETGAEVTLIARGEHLKALQNDGLRVCHPERSEVSHVAGDTSATTQYDVLRILAVASPQEAGTQDAVFLCCKSYDLPALAPTLAPMLQENTLIIPVCNGVPWWYFDVQGVPLSGFQPTCLDSEGTLQQHIDTKRILGGIAYMGASIPAAGTVHNAETARLLIGEPDGSLSERIKPLGEMLEQAGFKRPVREDIRAMVWWKLCWNIAFNPMGVITGKNCAEMASDPEILCRVRTIIDEMNTMGHAIGFTTPTDAEQHIKGAAALGAFKTSMQQDHAHGKRMEIEAIIESVLEISAQLDIPVPEIQRIHAEILKFS